jgi:hypothetical protein
VGPGRWVSEHFAAPLERCQGNPSFGLGSSVKLSDAFLGSDTLVLENALLVEPSVILGPGLRKGTLALLASQDQGTTTADALSKGLTGEYPGAEAQ